MGLAWNISRNIVEGDTHYWREVHSLDCSSPCIFCRWGCWAPTFRCVMKEDASVEQKTVVGEGQLGAGCLARVISLKKGYDTSRITSSRICSRRELWRGAHGISGKLLVWSRSCVSVCYWNLLLPVMKTWQCFYLLFTLQLSEPEIAFGSCDVSFLFLQIWLEVLLNSNNGFHWNRKEHYF